MLQEKKEKLAREDAENERKRKLAEFNASVKNRKVKTKKPQKPKVVPAPQRINKENLMPNPAPVSQTLSESKILRGGMSSMSVPLSKGIRVPRAEPLPQVKEEIKEMKDSKGSGPMRESELMSKRRPMVTHQDLSECGLDLTQVDPSVLPQLE